MQFLHFMLAVLIVGFLVKLAKGFGPTAPVAAYFF